MARRGVMNSWSQMYFSEITSRVVADSGIPTDRFHMGKIILLSLRDDPDLLMQIDGGTGETETNGSVLRRSIQCATCFRRMGVKRGDVMVLMAPTHLDVAIPLYAALYEGVIIAPVDMTFSVYELQDTFNTMEPKIIFCQNDKLQDVTQVLEESGSKAIVVTFDEGPDNDVLSFGEMMHKYRNETDEKDFKAADFDPDDTIAMLLPTSGTTGTPKAAALSHKNLAITGPYTWCISTKLPSPTRSVLLVSPLQWLSAILNYLIAPYMKYYRIQSSLPTTTEHIYELINKYKPTLVIISPTMLTKLMKPGLRDECDFSCFEKIYVGGSAVHQDLIQEINSVIPSTDVFDVYGICELGSLCLLGLGAPLGSCGKEVGCHLFKLVDVETGDEILEPRLPGELWLKGPGVFKGYYRNPKATQEAFTEDHWFKTGDMFYRDESMNYYFVERIKLLLKYKNHQISPVELEAVIRQHPGVLDVAVTSIPHAEFGDLPVACVVPTPGHSPTADELKDLVKNTLADTKQLRGGVVFLSELPLTASTKIHRRKLREMVTTMNRE